jgi:hypothetical protein
MKKGSSIAAFYMLTPKHTIPETVLYYKFK